MITNNMSTFIVVGVLLAAGAIPELVAGQHCGCRAELCCSQYGYCGSGYDYCGAGCREGPCLKTPAPNNNVSVPRIATHAFFDAISDQTDVSCAGKDFFTRDAFVEALYSYPQFGRAGSADDSKREVAAFFAHVAHATGHFCYIEDMNGPMRDYCDNTTKQYPCAANKGYYGRGAIHLSWNYNYGPAGKSIGFDGLNNPDIVAADPVISFKTALWFWMNRVQPMMTSSSHGFGATIRAINGKLECGGANPDNVNSRVDYYTEYCNLLGVDTGNDLRC